MGILKKSRTPKPPRSAVTIIAQGNKFSGEMNIVGKLHIDGLFEGTIASLDSISVGRRGEVRGQVKAHEITVSGLLEGEVHCQCITIENGGRVHGVVHSEEMIVARKGSFLGERLLLNETPSPEAEQSATPGNEEIARLLDDLPSFRDGKR
ncbi:polymer-forming cytoskeletal protein [Motiliproteus sp. SC1-56]|uniref:bactofilin family protein n=1 Tax=Motiliproteus sp. SC1-56 TaxID=2799565 RepID=UPI001A90B6A2|nr:polymer-forming cytoskeletal protein [Motiliproteus sp. SC1-56]